MVTLRVYSELDLQIVVSCVVAGHTSPNDSWNGSVVSLLRFKIHLSPRHLDGC